MLELSIAILAGGKGSRMGTDKAFLKVNNIPFLKIIYDKVSLLSDDIMVIIGNKEDKEFRDLLPSKAAILKDLVYTMSPVGGLITAALKSKKQYFAAIAVDMPLISTKVIEKLYFLALGHSAAIPVHKDGTLEVLCAVYNSFAIKEANLNSVTSLKELVKMLPNPIFINIENFRDVDPSLDSFFNVNTKEDLKILIQKLETN